MTVSVDPAGVAGEELRVRGASRSFRKNGKGGILPPNGGWKPPLPGRGASAGGALTVRRAPGEAGAAAVLLQFPDLPEDRASIRAALLRVYGAETAGDSEGLVQVHLVPGLAWTDGAPRDAGLNAVFASPGYVSGNALPAGHLTFKRTGDYRTADIAPALRRTPAGPVPKVKTSINWALSAWSIE